MTDKIEKVKEYTQKLVNDASVQENRPPWKTEFAICIMGNDLLFAINGPYERVRRLVENRLMGACKNLFGLYFHLVFPCTFRENSRAWNFSKYRLREDLDSTSTLGLWEVFGETYFIDAFLATVPDPETHDEKLRDAGYDEDIEYTPVERWEHYASAFKKVYGMAPMDYYMAKGKKKQKK